MCVFVGVVYIFFSSPSVSESVSAFVSAADGWTAMCRLPADDADTDADTFIDISSPLQHEHKTAFASLFGLNLAARGHRVDYPHDLVLVHMD